MNQIKKRMMQLKSKLKKYSGVVLFLTALIFNEGCSSSRIAGTMSKVITENKDKDVLVKPLDELYLNWLSTSGNKNISWKWALYVKENGKAKEYYSDEIYFIGTVTDNGIKTGIWEGYVKNKLVIKTSYPGSSANNSPMFVKIMDSQGKLLKEMNFSIVN